MTKMEVLNKETVQMRHAALVKKGINSDEECDSYTGTAKLIQEC